MNKRLLYYYFSRNYFFKLKRKFNEKRNYFFDPIIEKNDFIFSLYKNNIIKKMLFLSEYKRISLKKKLKRRRFRRWIFKKIYAKLLSYRIRNEYLLTIPKLFYKHKRRKSWWFVIGKKKSYRNIKFKYKKFRRRKKLLKNVKKLKIYRFPLKREVFDLKLKLNKIYFWLINTSKRQVLTLVKYNKLRYVNDIIYNYFRIKNFFFKKHKFLKKRRLYNYFLKKKKIYFKKLFKFYFNFYKNLLLINFYKNYGLYKFYILKFFLIFKNKLKKALIYKLNKFYLLTSYKELKFLKKRIKIKKRIKKKLLFIFNLSKYIPKIYKLKVRMVNTNFFITLTDYKDNVIVSKSTGQVSENRKKKVKLSPYLVTKMMYSILSKIKKLKIKFLFFFINTKINRHINNVMKIIKNFHYTKIVRVFFSKPIAHHFGTRKPKLRRL